MTLLRDKRMFPDVLIGTVWKGPNGPHGNPSFIGLDHPPPSAFEFRKLVRENLPRPFAGKLFSGTCLKVHSSDEYAIPLSRSPIFPVESNRNVRHKTFGWAKHPTSEFRWPRAMTRNLRRTTLVEKRAIPRLTCNELLGACWSEPRNSSFPNLRINHAT
jgi:hypothetical protein